MSLADSADSAPQLVALCRDAADGKAEALDVRFRIYRVCSILVSRFVQRVLAVVSSGNQERFQSALGGFHRNFSLFSCPARLNAHRCSALTPCIMELFEASSKEQDDRCRVLTLILCVRLCPSSSSCLHPQIVDQALHNRTCATNPAPASFQVPWPLSIRGQGLGSLSEEHVRAITTHKCVSLWRRACAFVTLLSESLCARLSLATLCLLKPRRRL